MKESIFKDSWRIGRIMDIPIMIHFSWLIVFGLITWSLSSFYFPRVMPKLPYIIHLVAGAVAALLLFASVAFHELSHSYVAKKYSIPIDSITLFIFGGVAQMRGEPPNPKAEFKIAVAGPFSSFFLSFIFFSVSYVTSGIINALFSYLALINFFIGAFNLIPGFPMDGGRVLRSALWAKRKDYFYATRIASNIGQGIALFFIIFGLFSIFSGMPSGLWLMLIGWFLFTASQASYQQTTLQQILSGIKVKDIMVREIIYLPPSMTIDEAVNEYFLRYGYGGFPVKDNEKFLGFITLKELRDVPREKWSNIKVDEVMVPHQRKWEVVPEEDAFKALELMLREDKGRLVVAEKEIVVGLITRNGISRYVQIMGQ